MKIIQIILVLIIMSTYVSSIDMPHTIMGFIYDLDGITPVQKETQCRIINTDTSDQVLTDIGLYQLPGIYSVTIPGVDGDLINIYCWNRYHNSSINVSLSGIMKNINLLLNDSYPYAPPVFASLPTTLAYVGETYYYDVDAIDPQGDTIGYELEESPSSMTISSSGLIVWNPTETGTYVVNVSATDEDDWSNYQTFSINVIETTGRDLTQADLATDVYQSTTQRITTSKSTTTTLTYDQSFPTKITTTTQKVPDRWNVINPTVKRGTDKTLGDKPKVHIVYGKIVKPEKMIDNTKKSLITINNGKGEEKRFLSIPLFKNEIYFKVIKLIKDDTIEIRAKKNNLFGEAIVNVISRFLHVDVKLEENIYEDEPDEIVNGIGYFSERPKQFMTSPQKKVFSYITIKDESERLVEPTISVDDLKSADPSKLTVSVYFLGKYYDLETQYYEYESGYKLYSEKPDFCRECTNYIITIKDEYKDESIKILESEFEEKQIEIKGATDGNPYLLEGIAYLNKFEMVSKGTIISVFNENTGKLFEEKTGLGPVSGKYSLIVYGTRDDSYKVSVVDNDLELFSKKIKINDDTYLNLKP